MGLLDARLLAYLKRPDAIWFPLLEIDASDGTTLRYTGKDAAVASKSLGLYEGRVEQWGTIGRAVSGRDGNLVAPTASITLDDRDRAIARKAPYILRRTARVKIAVHESAGVPAAAFFTYFTGTVFAYQQGPETWRLDLRQDDLSLEGNVPKRRFTVWDWPNIDRRNIGKPVPVIYGRHERLGFAGDKPGGMVPAYRVDSATYLYALAGHYLKAVAKVYVADVLKTVTTDYTITYPVRNGNQYTCIDFVVDPGEDAVVTADVDGMEATGDGTGVLVTGANSQWQHLLTNWIWGDYRLGNWPGADSRIDQALLTVALQFSASLGQASSRWLGELKTGLQWLDEWAQSWEAMMFWTNAGKLTTAFFEFRTQNDNIYPASPFIRWDEHRQGDSMTLTPDDQAYQANIRIEHALSAADGKYLESHVTQDKSATDRGVVSRQAPWLPAYGGIAYGDTFNNLARDVASRRINRYRNTVGRLTVSCPIHEIDSELLTLTPVSWDRGMIPGGVGWGTQSWERMLFLRTAYDLNLDTGEVTVTLEALRNAMTSFHHSGRTGTTVANGIASGTGEDGIFFVSVGSARTMTRASKKWSDDPGGYVAEQASGTVPVTKNGLMIEEAITNELLESSFGSGSGSKQYLYPDSTTLTLNNVESAWGEGHVGDLVLHPVVDDDHAAPDEDSSYVLFNASGLQNDGRFTFSNLNGSPAIASVVIKWRWDGTPGPGGGAVATAIPYLRTAATNYDGTPRTPASGAGYIDYSETYAVNPNTGLAWTVAQVNALEGGVRIDAAGGKALAHLTSIYLEVNCTSSAVLYNQGGGGQGTITFDTADYLFQDSKGAAVTTAKLAAANPAQATNMALSYDTASLIANSKVRVSIDYKNVTTSGLLYWRLQRLFDNFTWNASTKAWGAAVVNNVLGDGVTSPDWHRELVGVTGLATPDAPIDVGANATVLRLFVLQITGFTNNLQIDRVGHMQVEKFDGWSSRKMSDGGAYAGAADALSWSNDGTLQKIVPNKRGTMRATLIPNWDVLGGGGGPAKAFYVWSLQYSAGHKFALRYAALGTGFGGASYRWEFLVSVGGTTYCAFVGDTAISVAWPDRNTNARDIYVRWTSSVGDLGLAAGTASIWTRIGGVLTKGTDAVFGATPPTEAAATFHFGSNLGAEQFNGEIRDFRIMPFCLTDGEIGYDQPS